MTTFFSSVAEFPAAGFRCVLAGDDADSLVMCSCGATIANGAAARATMPDPVTNAMPVRRRRLAAAGGDAACFASSAATGSRVGVPAPSTTMGAASRPPPPLVVLAPSDAAALFSPSEAGSSVDMDIAPVLRSALDTTTRQALTRGRASLDHLFHAVLFPFDHRQRRRITGVGVVPPESCS
jgi:hypothetical protein